MTRGAGLFVAGTDTGVGKTVVTCALARGLRARGLDVAAMKPIETGVGAEGPSDARALQRAAGGVDPLELVCPQRFALPAAPSAAARQVGTPVDLAAIRTAFDALAARHERVLVEGAGGLLVPIADGFAMADLAGWLELPVLLVARGSLGTINHTLLSCEALASRGLALAGVVISHGPRPLSDADAENLRELRCALGPRLLAELPPLGADEPFGRDPAAVAALVAAVAAALARGP